MSTRCQIRIKRRTVYQHSDGYPDAVIPDLKEFLKWNDGRNTDVEYCTANFIYWSKRKFADMSNKWAAERGKKIPAWDSIQSTNISYQYIGYGICENDEFHGDIEYFYSVVIDMTGAIGTEDKPTITINCYDRGVKLKDRANVEPIKKEVFNYE